MKKITFFEVGSGAEARLNIYFRFKLVEFIAGIGLLLLIGGLVGVGIFYGLTRESSEPAASALLDSEQLTRRDFVRNMARESWRSLSRQAKNSSNGFWLDDHGVTTIESLNSLWLMDLKEEYDEGRDWVAREFDVRKINSGVYLFHVASEFVGPLLSCYALTGDEMYLEKAKEVGELMENAVVENGKSLFHLDRM